EQLRKLHWPAVFRLVVLEPRRLLVRRLEAWVPNGEVPRVVVEELALALPAGCDEGLELVVLERVVERRGSPAVLDHPRVEVGSVTEDRVTDEPTVLVEDVVGLTDPRGYLNLDGRCSLGLVLEEGGQVDRRSLAPVLPEPLRSVMQLWGVDALPTHHEG